MMPPITVDLALAAGRRLAREAKVELVDSTSMRRAALVYLMALLYFVTGKGWKLDHVRDRVSMTIPRFPAAVAVLKVIPIIGGPIAEFAEKYVHERASIFVSPAAESDGITFLGVVAHELGHVGDAEVGGLLWCISYLVTDEVRAGAERCYGSDAAHEVLLRGRDPEEVRRDIEKSLEGYGLDTKHLGFAKRLLSVHIESLKKGVDPTGTVERSIAALQAEGWGYDPSSIS